MGPIVPCMGMKWTEPQYEEISLGCEINSYASAEI
jgi:coenzyme PQQ precursor peptide PqqA